MGAVLAIRDGKQLPDLPEPPEQLMNSLCGLYDVHRLCTEAGLLFTCASGHLVRDIGSNYSCNPETGKIIKGKSLQELSGKE